MRSHLASYRNAFALGALLLLPTAPARAEGLGAPFRLENHLPSRTLCLFSVADVSATCEQVGQLRIAQLFRDPGMQQFVQPVMQLVQGQLHEMREHAEGNPELSMVVRGLEMLSLIRGQVAFSFVDVRTDTMVASPVVLAAIDFRENVGRFRELLAPMLDHVSSELGLERRMETLGGVSVESIFFGPVRVWHTFVDGVWLLSTDGRELENVLTGANARDALAASEKFRRVKARVAPKGEQLLLYCDLQHAWTRFGDWIPAEYRGMVQALGLTGIETFAYGCEFADGAVHDTIHVGLAKERRGIPALWKPQRVSHSMLRFVPANALYYGSTAIDLQHLYTQGRAIAATFGPDVDEQVAGFVRHLEEHLGISLQADLLAPMGNELGLYVAPPTGGGLIPDVVAYAHLRDPARFQRTFRKLAQAASQMLAEEGVHLGLKEHAYMGVPYLTIDVSFEHSRDPFPLRPCVAFSEDGVAFTLVPHAMKNAIENVVQGGAKPALKDDPDFRSMLALAPQGHCAFGYLDTKAFTVWAYNTLMPVAQAVLHGNFLERNLGVPFPIDLADMPTGKVFAEYMSSCAEWATSDADGFSVTWRTPTGIVPLVAALGAGAATFLMASGEAVEFHDHEGEFGAFEPEHEVDDELPPGRRGREATPHRAHATEPRVIRRGR